MYSEYTVSEILRRAPSYAVKTAHRFAIEQYMNRYFASHPNHPAQSHNAAVSMVRAAESVLVLCWGNVCRSPLAEKYLEAHCKNQQFDLAVSSAGLGETEGRASPESAVEIAAKYGVDLSEHRSKRVESSAVSAADVVFVMDYNNYYSFTKRYQNTHNKTFFLGALDDVDDIQISDPYGSDPAQFEDTYDRITAALDRLIDELANDT